MNKDKSTSSSLSDLSTNEIVVVDEIDHYSEEWIPPFAFREGISLNKRQKISDFYKFEEPIGEGKFGRVFKCIEKSTHLCLAAKCIKIKKDSELKQISILTKMRHKCIAQIYDAYYIEKNFDKEVILIMEIVEGGELFDRVVEDSYILTELAIALIIHQICEAIKYIHSNNFIHLDLKPENIMCVSQSSNQIKLIDFGLAQHYDGEHDLLFMAGTPEFAAPEVIKYEPLNFHTDMWSVGVITYILLSGQSPFLGPNIAITYNKVEKGDWSFCDEFETNHISQEAKDFISRLLVLKKENRMLPGDCLNHPWLKSSLDKSHLLYNKKENPSIEQQISKEKLKKYLKNKKFRKIVFGVLFINQVLKMITTMQLKKNQKGLLYAKNLLQAAKLSEIKDDKVESAQSVTDTVLTNTNSSKKATIKVKKVLKTKKIPRNVEEGSVGDDANKNKVIEKGCIKDESPQIKVNLENSKIEATKRVELSNVVVKKNLTEGTKKSSSLKENRDELRDKCNNDDQKCLNDCAILLNTSNSKKIHSINEKLNNTYSNKDCEKQKNAENVEEVVGNIKTSDITETNKIKNTLKKGIKSCVAVDNTKIINENTGNLQTTIEKRKLSIKTDDSKKSVNVIENQKLKEKKAIKKVELTTTNSKVKEGKICTQQQLCDENITTIISDTTNTKKSNENKLLNESKDVPSSNESSKKVKKIIKKTSVKKKVQLEQRQNLEYSNSQISNTISDTSKCLLINKDKVEDDAICKKESLNKIPINNTLQSTIKNSSSPIKKNDNKEIKISSNELLEGDVKLLEKKCKESIQIINDVKKDHKENTKNKILPISLKESAKTSDKEIVNSNSNKQVSNKESNKIERKRCIIRKKNIKMDESDIIAEHEVKKCESTKETVKQSIHVESKNIGKLSFKSNNEESHKTTTKVTSNINLSTNSLKKSTVNVKNSDTISLELNLQNDLDDSDEDVFSFAKLKNQLEQRLSNKKQKESIDNLNIKRGSIKGTNDDIFELNGLCRVDFDNVKSVKNKWLKIEKETFS